jgi:hypothetical protein
MHSLRLALFLPQQPTLENGRMAAVWSVHKAGGRWTVMLSVRLPGPTARQLELAHLSSKPAQESTLELESLSAVESPELEHNTRELVINRHKSSARIFFFINKISGFKFSAFCTADISSCNKQSCPRVRVRLLLSRF